MGRTRDGEGDREQAALSATRTLLQRGDTLDEVGTYLDHRPNHHPRHGQRWTRQTVGAVVCPCGSSCRSHVGGQLMDAGDLADEMEQS